jgi:hypothetical protein
MSAFHWAAALRVGGRDKPAVNKRSTRSSPPSPTHAGLVSAARASGAREQQQLAGCPHLRPAAAREPAADKPVGALRRLRPRQRHAPSFNSHSARQGYSTAAHEHLRSLRPGTACGQAPFAPLDVTIPAWALPHRPAHCTPDLVLITGWDPSMPPPSPSRSVSFTIVDVAYGRGDTSTNRIKRKQNIYPNLVLLLQQQGWTAHGTSFGTSVYDPLPGPPAGAAPGGTTAAPTHFSSWSALLAGSNEHHQRHWRHLSRHHRQSLHQHEERPYAPRRHRRSKHISLKAAQLTRH